MKIYIYINISFITYTDFNKWYRLRNVNNVGGVGENWGGTGEKPTMGSST